MKKAFACMKKASPGILVLIGAAAFGRVVGAEGEASSLAIAGGQPSERPAGAPVILEFVKPRGWYTRALTGISQPYPSSLRFLEDQGAWYTPFNRPGMLGYYDIRGWHHR